MPTRRTSSAIGGKSVRLAVHWVTQKRGRISRTWHRATLTPTLHDPENSGSMILGVRDDQSSSPAGQVTAIPHSSDGSEQAFPS